jgi:hypothetical protein
MSIYSPEKPLCPRFIARRIVYEGKSFDFISHTRRPLMVFKVPEDANAISVELVIQSEELEQYSDLDKIFKLADHFLQEWRKHKTTK